MCVDDNVQNDADHYGFKQNLGRQEPIVQSNVAVDDSQVPEPIENRDFDKNQFPQSMNVPALDPLEANRMKP